MIVWLPGENNGTVDNFKETRLFRRVEATLVRALAHALVQFLDSTRVQLVTQLSLRFQRYQAAIIKVFTRHFDQIAGKKIYYKVLTFRTSKRR